MVLVSLVKVDEEVAMPVPLALMRAAGLHEGDVVEISVREGRMIIERPCSEILSEDGATSKKPSINYNNAD
ncbi:MAG: AbrB/MazE/SpoVT family DNA-binding domain-containing protein [Allorhizobium sp.]